MVKSRNLGFRPDIEGLRAIAVLGVVVFHAAIPHLAGGFIGVDVFYVISGFLITGLMVKEIESSGRVDMMAFYARRCRRILPSAATVTIATVIAGWFILPPLGVHQMAVDAMYAAVYVANWHFIAEGTNYLAVSTSHSPFLHYWSLAVEEQFYLVFPAVAIGSVWIARRLGLTRTSVLMTVLAASFAVSFIYSLHLTGYLPTTAYLSTPARVWQFAAGAMLAVGVQTGWFVRHSAKFSWIAIPVGFAGLFGVIYATVMFGRNTPYPGTAALLPTFGTVAIILAGSVPQRGPTAGWILSLPPVRWVGRLSFAWYLTHWPCLVFAQVLDPKLSWEGATAVVFGAMLPAYAVMQLVERPIRLSPVISRSTRSGISVGVMTTAGALIAALSFGTVAVDLLGGVAAYADVPPLTSVFGHGAGPTHGSVTPSPINAAKDRPYPDACIVPPTGSLSPTSECEFGPVNGQKVVLMGDSHAQQWQPALQTLAPKLNWRIYVITKAGCPVPNIYSRLSAQSDLSMPECKEWRANEVERIVNQIRPKMIVVSSLNHYISDQTLLLADWTDCRDC
jgi:peptidoglycan/LPS O-acetylase OafA/YrhL